jgi:hypothetical protein
MWSEIVKPDEEVVKEDNIIEDFLSTIPVVREHELRFKREMDSFVEEYKDALDNIYKKHFKEYGHISKKDFYIFAYLNTRNE